MNKSNEMQVGEKIICRARIGVFKSSTGSNNKLTLLIWHCDVMLNKSNVRMTRYVPPLD